MTAASGARFPSLNPVVKEKTVMAMLRMTAMPVLIIFPSFPGNFFERTNRESPVKMIK